MRRIAIAVSFCLAMVALIPSAALARGPEKNDSVSGHGFVVFSPTTTYDFRVSAHTISSTTTVATGNMYIQAVVMDATGTTTIAIWADVFCLSALSVQAEVRGHIYRTEPDLLTEPTDLIFNVTDLSGATSGPDLFDATTGPVGVDCVTPPPPGVFPVAKGNVTVNDEL
jgi:hypothetical protein